MRVHRGGRALGVVLLVACARVATADRPHRAPDAARADVPAAPVDAAPPTAADAGRSAWTDVGHGVAVRDLGVGRDVVVALAGWRITAESTRAWVDALYLARLRALGARYLYAVQGPAEVDHRSHDLAVGALADALVARRDAGATNVLVVAHSSGAEVAAELFADLFRARPDRGGALRDHVWFISLDGDADVRGDPTRSLAPDTVDGLRHAWFVTARDGVHGISALSNATMRAQHARYPARSTFLEYDARDAGCAAVLCVHVSLINPHPAPRGNASYARFGPEGPNTWWLDGVAARWLR